MGKVGLCPFSGPVFQATTLSPTAILLADEIICEARKYAGGVKLEDDFLLDEIKEVGPGGSYFGTRTTFDRFKELYQRHLRLLKLQGKSQKTIDAYSRALRRVSEHFNCCPDQLTPEQLEIYFGELVDSHSWSTVKIDRNGLQFIW
ncbi:MAG: phage integrase N-terminal SAM-like domain-containing protein [Deltaproteobacteria bacterium]|nr:phage integrase N-terminal SAM-like domain-containing protein [Deltaproteobacteria bacterium]